MESSIPLRGYISLTHAAIRCISYIFHCTPNDKLVNLSFRWHWLSMYLQIWSHYSLGTQNRWYFHTGAAWNSKTISWMCISSKVCTFAAGPLENDVCMSQMKIAYMPMIYFLLLHQCYRFLVQYLYYTPDYIHEYFQLD